MGVQLGFLILINIFVVCCIWHKFVRALTNLSQCGRVCRVWTCTKMFVTFNAHDPFVIGFFKTSKSFSPQYSNRVDVSVNVQCCFFQINARVDHRRTAHNVNFYVARTFTLQRQWSHLCAATHHLVHHYWMTPPKNTPEHKILCT
jgi:hypothetical protein